MATKEQINNALRAIADMIIETVKETQGTFGTPSGPMYAALIGTGMSLDQYEQIMSGLVAAKKLRKQGHCYFAV